MFDQKYYQEKKVKLQQKAQQMQQEYLQGAFKFTTEFNDIVNELNKIAEWEKENIKPVENTKPVKK
jgi:hypothetical protein